MATRCSKEFTHTYIYFYIKKKYGYIFKYIPCCTLHACLSLTTIMHFCPSLTGIPLLFGYARGYRLYLSPSKSSCNTPFGSKSLCTQFFLLLGEPFKHAHTPIYICIYVYTYIYWGNHVPLLAQTRAIIYAYLRINNKQDLS